MNRHSSRGKNKTCLINRDIERSALEPEPTRVDNITVPHCWDLNDHCIVNIPKSYQGDRILE